MLNNDGQMNFSTTRCSLLPSAPVIENCDNSISSIPLVCNPPPYSPPLVQHAKCAKEPFLSTRITRNENGRLRQPLKRYDTDMMFKVALFEGIIAVFMLSGGIWCSMDSLTYCPYYSAIWTSTTFVINALVGIAAAKRCTINLFVAYLVLSLISLMLGAIGATIFARNWLLIGTYQHPTIDRNQAFCLIGQYDAPRMRYIVGQLNRYDFKKCLFQLKIGTSINAVQFIIAIIEAILNFISSVLCCKQLCTKCFHT